MVSFSMTLFVSSLFLSVGLSEFPYFVNSPCFYLCLSVDLSFFMSSVLYFSSYLFRHSLCSVFIQLWVSFFRYVVLYLFSVSLCSSVVSMFNSFVRSVCISCIGFVSCLFSASFLYLSICYFVMSAFIQLLISLVLDFFSQVVLYFFSQFLCVLLKYDFVIYLVRHVVRYFVILSFLACLMLFVYVFRYFCHS